ncbi:MAG TPA: helix-turn-helix domain-containing protein [Edaphocola sp.]|nr:helix-turn-helix domain-containing protein [Edaphocola sp.]
MYFFILLLSLPATILFANNKSPKDSLFDKAFYYAATELSANNLEEALKVSDSLYKNSINNLQKIKSLMLLATLQEDSGAIEEALKNAVKAEKINLIENNLEWAIRISGFLSTTFRSAGLNTIGFEYLRKAEALNKKKFSPLFETFIFQEHAFYAFENKNYLQAIDFLKKSIISAEKMPSSKINPIFLGTSFTLMGASYLKLNKFIEADSLFHLTLSILNHIESPLKGVAIVGLGEIALNNNNMDTAILLFEEGRKYAEQSNYYKLKDIVYKNMMVYYTLLQDSTKIAEYKTKSLILSEERLISINQISKNIISEIEKEKKKSEIIFNTSLILLVSIFLSALYFIFRKFKKKNALQKSKYLEIIHRINEKNLENTVTSELELSTSASNLKAVDKKDLLPIETEERLLKDLKKLESRDFYIKKEISLSALAVKLNTNQKYLSYLINKHKGVDFNNYINQLRIDYILNKLKNNEVYLDYKIAHLAEECGFSSHSKFTQVFKNYVGMVPSAFINQQRKARMII